MPSFIPSWRDSGETKLILREMACSPHSTVRRAQSDAVWPFAKPCVSLASTCALASTPANLCYLLGKSAPLLCTLGPALPHWHNPAKCWFRCVISLPGRGYNSRKGAPIRSRGCLGPGRSMQYRAVGEFDGALLETPSNVTPRPSLQRLSVNPNRSEADRKF